VEEDLPVADRLEEVRDRISAAAERAGRDARDVLLIAVTKGVSGRSSR
jgi:uncharacterized pyridoxal phosphate-containing UPF0001 family protein